MEFSHAKERRSLQHRHLELEGDVKASAEAAIRNELVTRQRVELLEKFLSLGFKARLKWLLFGKFD